MQKENKTDELFAELEEGVRGVYTSEAYLKYLSFASKFYRYSARNTLLIFLQRPTSTLVAGFQKWKKEFGRNVKKGEKAIRIIGCSTFETERETAVPDGKGGFEKEKIKCRRFFPVSVFDVSQTEGDELPAHPCKDPEGDVEGYEDLLAALFAVSPVPIKLANDIEKPGVKGYFHNMEKRIAIRDGMGQAETIDTAVHEIAHAMLHDETKLDRSTKEVEAESVAFIAAASLGLDTSCYSFPYIATWAESKDEKQLLASQERITGTARRILEGIEGKQGKAA